MEKELPTAADLLVLLQTLRDANIPLHKTRIYIHVSEDDGSGYVDEMPEYNRVEKRIDIWPGEQ